MAMAYVSTLLFFDPQTGEDKKRAIKQRTTTKPEKEQRLFCAACRHLITHQNERIPVQGAHEHRCANPHGITYHIGCFHEAAGCTAIGEATTEYTWFPGYAWCIALCANCRAHLGWRFQSEDDYFYGLIVDRLTSAGPAKN
ncbi:MAG: hypothetical protein Tsb0026_19730 [Sulfuricaulis sp.]